MKKTFALSFAVILLFLSFPFSVFAADYSTSMYDYVAEELLAQSDYIDIAKYGATAAQVEDMMENIYKNEPELFYLELRYSYSYSGSKILSILPEYNMSSDAISEAKKFVSDKLDAIVATLPEGLDDAEKALYFHDYICLNFEYDLTYTIYDIYNMLKESTAVCQGYSLLYDALLTRVGIENHSVTTENHMWNQVKINNNWYHVDVTWDDPISDLFGRACHDNFLVSDTVIAESHLDEYTTSFDAEYVSDDTSFDSLSWHYQTMPFAFANGNIYCLDDNTVSRMDIYTANHTYVYTVTDKWHSESGTYIDCFSGFGSYKNKIIFNTDCDIKYLDPTDGTVGTVATPDLPDSNYIYRMYVSGNKAVFMYDTSYSRTGEISSVQLLFEASTEIECNHSGTCEKTLSDGSTEIRCSGCDELLETKPASEPEFILGDVNADGVIDMFDYIIVQSIYFGKYNYTADEYLRADANEDGTVDMFDYLLVKSIYFNS